MSDRGKRSREEEYKDDAVQKLLSSRELKWKDYVVHDLNITTSGGGNLVRLVDPIRQGTGMSQRVGTRVRVESISITLGPSIYVNNVSGAMVGGNYSPAFGWALVYDKKPTSSNPVFTDLFGAVDYSQMACNMRLNMTYRDRFSIIGKGYWVPNAFYNSATNRVLNCGTVFDRRLTIPLLQEFKADGSTVSCYSTGAIYLMARVAGGMCPVAWNLNLCVDIRLRYRDLHSI